MKLGQVEGLEEMGMCVFSSSAVHSLPEVSVNNGGATLTLVHSEERLAMSKWLFSKVQGRPKAFYTHTIFILDLNWHMHHRSLPHPLTPSERSGWYL